MFNPRNPDDLKKLDDARRASYRQLEAFRKERASALQQFVGFHYGDGGTRERVPLNLIAQGARTYVRKLIARQPRVRASTKFRELEEFAFELQDAVNETINEIQLGRTLEEIVLNAIFGVGIAKVGVTQTADDIEGFLHDTGEVFVDSIDLSDWVHDMSAKRMEAWQFCGNRYELPRETVVNNPLFDESARNAVQKKSEMKGSLEGERHNPHDLEQSFEHEDNDLYDMVELWDIWLPKDGVVVTFSEDALDKPLNIVEWNGPEGGPYHLLGYQKVPNSVMPLPPVALWMDLHELVNNLSRKAGRQADRQKTVVGYQAPAQADAERLRDAADGEIIRMDDPTMVKEFKTGGADPATVQLAGMMRDTWSRDAGNIDALGGLAPSSGTVGQDKLLNASASELIQELQEKTELFTTGVVRAMAHYLFEDPTGVKAVQRRIEGVDETLLTYWGPNRRMGKIFQYNLEIVPYSMRPVSPEENIAKLYAIFDRVAPLAMQMGWTIDFPRFLSIVANGTDSPELKQILIPADPEVAAQLLGGEPPPKMPRAATREVAPPKVSGQKPDFAAQFAQMAAGQAAVSQ